MFHLQILSSPLPLMQKLQTLFSIKVNLISHFTIFFYFFNYSGLNVFVEGMGTSMDKRIPLQFVHKQMYWSLWLNGILLQWFYFSHSSFLTHWTKHISLFFVKVHLILALSSLQLTLAEITLTHNVL